MLSAQRLNQFVQLGIVLCVLFFGQQIARDILAYLGHDQQSIAANQLLSEPSRNCQPLWLNHASNDHWLECEVTQRLARFCGPDGHKDIVAKISAYAEHKTKIDAGLAHYNVDLAKHMQVTGEYNESVKRAAQDFVNKDLKKAALHPRLNETRIVDLIATLALQGLVKPTDFDLALHPVLQSAFQGIPEHVPNACNALT